MQSWGQGGSARWSRWSKSHRRWQMQDSNASLSFSQIFAFHCSPKERYFKLVFLPQSYSKESEKLPGGRELCWVQLSSGQDQTFSALWTVHREPGLVNRPRVGCSPSLISVSFATTLLRDLAQAAQPLWAMTSPSVQQGRVFFLSLGEGEWLITILCATALQPTPGGVRMGWFLEALQ